MIRGLVRPGQLARRRRICRVCGADLDGGGPCLLSLEPEVLENMAKARGVWPKAAGRQSVGDTARLCSMGER